MEYDNDTNTPSVDDVINRIKAEASPLYTDATIQRAVDLVRQTGVQKALERTRVELDKINTALRKRGAHGSWRDFKDFWTDVEYLISSAAKASSKAFDRQNAPTS